MALSLNDKKVKRSALGEVKQHLPKKTAVMPWQEVQKTKDSSTADTEDSASSTVLNPVENGEPYIATPVSNGGSDRAPSNSKLSYRQNGAKVRPKLGQDAAETSDRAQDKNLGQSEAKLRPKLGQDATETVPDVQSTDLGQSEAKVRPKSGRASSAEKAGAVRADFDQIEPEIRPKLGQVTSKHQSSTDGKNLGQSEAKVGPKLGQSGGEPKCDGTHDVGAENLGQSEVKVRPKLGRGVTESRPESLAVNLGQSEAKLRPKLGHVQSDLYSEDILPIAAANLGQSEAKVRPKLGRGPNGAGSSVAGGNLGQSEAKVGPKLGRQSNGPGSGVTDSNLGQSEAKVRPKLGQQNPPGRSLAKQVAGGEDAAGRHDSQMHSSIASESVDYRNLGQSEANDSLTTASPKTVASSLTASQETASSHRGQRNLEAELLAIPVKHQGGHFSHLVGLQRSILMHLCRMAGSSPNRQTPALTIAGVMEAVCTTAYGARKAIQRLEMKSLLCRIEFKDGRGGWTRYEIQKDAWDEIKILELNLGQSEAKLEPK